jgi:hypothetical protein
MSLETDTYKVEQLPISIGDALVYLDPDGKFDRISVGRIEVKISSIGDKDISRTTIKFSGSYEVIISLREDGSVTSIASKALDSKSTYHEIIVFDRSGKPITQTNTDKDGNPVSIDY